MKTPAFRHRSGCAVITTGQATGFSLIELVAILGIMTILLSLALPAMTGISNGYRRASTADLLASDLNRARLEAISRNRATIVCPSANGWDCIGGADWSSGWLSFVDSNGNRERDPNETVLRYTQPTAVNTRVAGNPGRTRIQFQGSGGSYGSNSSWTICSPNIETEQRGLVLSNSGRLRSTTRPSRSSVERCLGL